MMLSDTQVQHYLEHGYTLAPQFFDPDELSALRAEVSRFRASGLLRNVATDGDGRTPTVQQVNLQLVPIAPHSPLFRALPFADKVQTAVRQLLGARVVKILDQLFLKPAGRGLPTNWHTDNAYFRIRDPLRGCALWIAVDDATPANGTLKVVPDVHQDKFEHYRDPQSDHHIRMADCDTRAVHCELPAGGVAFFSFGTPHATGANPTDADRTGIGVHFVNEAFLTDDMRAERVAVGLVPMQDLAADSPFSADVDRWPTLVETLAR